MTSLLRLQSIAIGKIMNQHTPAPHCPDSAPTERGIATALGSSTSRRHATQKAQKLMSGEMSRPPHYDLLRLALSGEHTLDAWIARAHVTTCPACLARVTALNDVLRGAAGVTRKPT